MTQVTSDGKTSGGKWADIFRKNPHAEFRLFCFPYAGGSSMIFRPWVKALPPFVEMVAVQYPGRGSRILEPPFKRLTAIADAIYTEMGPLVAEKPFAFFGHSMGATIAFEVAARLAQNNGPRPVMFFASGRQAPHVPDRDPVTYHLPDKELLSELRRLNGTPKEILESEEVMQLLLPIIRADFELIQTYEYSPSPRLECPLIALGGIGDVDIPRTDLEAWCLHTSSTCSVRMFPGDHFFLHSCESMVLQTMARELARCLDLLPRTSKPR
jgi:medium-chain acyl-[acyl-carrier-protein] hydrolase